MGSEIGNNHHKLPYHVQVHNEAGAAVAGGGGKPQGTPGQGGTPSAKDPAVSGQPATPPPGTGPTHQADKSQHAHAAPQESIADKKAKGHHTGDEVVINQQVQQQQNLQLLNSPPPTPDDAKISTNATANQRLTLSMLHDASDLMATYTQVKSEKSKDKHSEINDMMKEIQKEVKKREEFNKKLETVFASIMGQIGGDQDKGTMCRDQLNDKNNELVQRLETELHCTPDQAQALVQGVRDGGAAGTALALSLATMLARKEMQQTPDAAGSGADGTGIDPAGGPQGASDPASDGSDPQANGLDASAQGTDPTAGATPPDGAPDLNAQTDLNDPATRRNIFGDPSTPQGLETSPGADVYSSTAVDANAPPPGIDQLVADAKRYDETTGGLFSGPDQTSAAAMQLMDDAAQGGDGNIDGKGGASGGGEKALLLAGAFLSGATSPEDALAKLKDKDAQEIKDLVAAAKKMIIEMVAASLLTQAVEGSASHAKDWLHKVFKPDLAAGAQPPTGLRG